VNTVEQQLRAELRAESELITQGSLRQPDFRQLDDPAPARPLAGELAGGGRRQRLAWLAPVAAAAAVAVIVATAAVVSRHGPSAGPEPSGAGKPTAGEINAVAAFSARDVWAVGSLNLDRPQGSDASVPLVEHWNGFKWRRVPVPADPALSELNAIAGTSSDNLWAVGGGFGAFKPVILHWDGRAWRVQRLAANKAGNLRAVAVTSATDAWAVGQTGGRVPGALILHWNGKTWSKVPAPAATGDRFLSGVAATSARDVWAVGSAVDPRSSSSGLYIIHWNGSSWTQVPASHLHAVQPVLESAAAGPDGTIWAAGLTDGDHTATLLMRWTGTAWQRVAGGTRGLGDATYAIAVLSARDVWAAGGGASDRNTVILHWNGTAWTRIAAPGATFPGRINGLAATSADDIWAVGYRGADGYAGVPQILHWNGSKWSRSFGPASTSGLNETSSCGPYCNDSPPSNTPSP
jgi:hypothetical protein